MEKQKKNASKKVVDKKQATKKSTAKNQIKASSKNPKEKSPVTRKPGQSKQKTSIPKSNQADPQDMLNTLTGIFAQVESKSGKASIREENNLDDIVQNAVIIGHPNRFQDMPETMSYIRELTAKLMTKGYLTPGTKPFAKNLLAAMLKYLWDTQNLFYLDPDMAAGQAGTLRVFIDDINKYWSDPVSSDWFQNIKDYPAQVDTALQFIDSCTWEDVYKHLSPKMDELFIIANAKLEKIKKNHPEVLGLCSAYLAGVAIEKNTFSPFDGSVPEDIGKKLDDLYFKLSQNHESLFFQYLTAGFKSVREKTFDELDRWKLTKK